MVCPMRVLWCSALRCSNGVLADVAAVGCGCHRAGDQSRRARGEGEAGMTEECSWDWHHYDGFKKSLTVEGASDEVVELRVAAGRADGSRADPAR